MNTDRPSATDAAARHVAHTVCPLDCPDRCSLEVTVEAGRVTGIDGSRVNPVTDGFICGKVRNFTKRLYGPERLLHPMRRTGKKGSGAFEAISWDEAIATIAARFATVRSESGGEAILPFCYGGSNGLITQDAADARLFRGLGASRLLRTVCAEPTGFVARVLYGKMPVVDFPDFEAARFILVWGANPRESNIHLVPYLKAAKANGAKIAVIDPRRIAGGGMVDFHLPVWPGSDAAVALAMIAHLERQGRVDRDFLARHATGAERLLETARAWTLERAAAAARVEAKAIAALADAYADASPALVRCGWGVERNRNAESAVAAILALPAVAGKFGVRGGGYALSSSGSYRVDHDAVAGVTEPPTREINMNRLGRALLEQTSPPVRALFVYNANPAATIPDQGRVLRGLEREDLFTVVFEQVMTDTALYADILLPATTFLEHTELSTSYGTYSAMLGEPVMQPVGESKSNEEVFTLLGRALGLDPEKRWPTGETQVLQALAAIRGPLEGQGGEDRLRRLRERRVLRMDFPGEAPVQFVTVFPGTSDRKIHFWPDEWPKPYEVLADPEELPGRGRHPLALISPATDRSISSTLAEYGFKEAVVTIHPDDAAARRLQDGGLVRVHNDLGEVVVRLKVSDEVRPGVASLPKGIWNRHTKNGRVGNTLVPDDISSASGGACFNDARVEVAMA
ncbi:MAG TPA: molybdopterin-dependent oxidoreductase [Verrucomicrobiae bacterium]|nr:molybdopterin-dependent oxidoreductase [Verrucomicrobiae bacterium]